MDWITNFDTTLSLVVGSASGAGTTRFLDRSCRAPAPAARRWMIRDVAAAALRQAAGYTPPMHMRRIGPAWFMDTARVFGDVTLGEDVSLWCGAVVRGDVAPVTIGARCNLQDNVIVHCDDDVPLAIGDDVTMGHGAIVHCEAVGSGSLIAIGARVLAGSRVGARCLIGAGAVVPPRLVVPDDMLVMGVPGRIVRRVSEAEAAYLRMVPERYMRLARLHAEHPDDSRCRPFAPDTHSQ